MKVGFSGLVTFAALSRDLLNFLTLENNFSFDSLYNSCQDHAKCAFEYLQIDT